MVADDIRECGGLDFALEADQVEESFIAACVFRTLLDRKEIVKLHCDERRISHLSLGCARMNILALDMNSRARCIEVFVLELSYASAIHSISVFSSELGYVEFHYSASDFLVRSESDLHFAVLELRMLYHILHSIHDLSDTSLVVCSEEGCSVCGDESLADILHHLRELTWFEAESGHALERNIAAVIILDNLRFDIRS